MSRAEYMRKYRANRNNVTDSPQNVTDQGESVTESLDVTENVTGGNNRVAHMNRVDQKPILTGSDIPWQDVPLEVFKMAGRGVTREHKGELYVMVARQPDQDYGVISLEYWKERLEQVCGCGRMGFSCKPCLA